MGTWESGNPGTSNCRVGLQRRAGVSLHVVVAVDLASRLVVRKRAGGWVRESRDALEPLHLPPVLHFHLLVCTRRWEGLVWQKGSKSA